MRDHITAKSPSIVTDPAGAVERLEAWLGQDPPDINPQARMRWLTHGKKVDKAIVFLHGLTASPRQFYQLGEMFHDAGCNVLIPRFPGHGLLDRMTPALASLTQDQLLDTTNRALDLAHGLGERVSVAGLSVGGVLAGWAAQNRGDIQSATMIAPFMGAKVLPLRLTPLIARAALLLPNWYRWWDPQARDKPRPPMHAYPRVPSRALATGLRMGERLRRQARRSPPQAHTVWVFTNPTDQFLNNQPAAWLVENWRKAGAQNVHTYEFDAALKLPHNIIDPEIPEGRVEVSHPILLERLLGGM
jgi:carboxylesterase